MRVPVSHSALLIILLVILGLGPGELRLGVAVANVKSSQVSSADAWAMLHHDAARTGFAAGTAPTVPRMLWNFSTGGYIWSSPLIANGSVYVFSPGSRNLFAVNQSTGKMLWQTRVGSARASSPTLYGDSVYVGANSSLYRINAANGQIIWNTTTGGSWDVSLLGAEGRIYVANESVGAGYLSVSLLSIDAMNGSILWDVPGGSAEPAYWNGLVYTGYGSQIEALNATSGKLVWNYSITSRAYGGFAISAGVLYGGGDDMYALNASTGRFIWRSTNAQLAESPAIAYNKIFESDGGNGVAALDQLTGSPIWVFPYRGAGGSFSDPAVAGGLIFAGGGGIRSPSDPTIYALNASDGSVIWSFRALYGENSSPAISNGTVYVGDDGGVLYAIGNLTNIPQRNGGVSPFVLGLFVIVILPVVVLVLFLFRSRFRRRSAQFLQAATNNRLCRF